MAASIRPPWRPHGAEESGPRCTRTSVEVWSDDEHLWDPRQSGRAVCTRLSNLTSPRDDASCATDRAGTGSDRARAMGEDVERLAKKIFDSDDVLLQLRRVQAIVAHLEGFPIERARNAARRALHFDSFEYRAIKRILAKGLDFEPLPEEPARALGAEVALRAHAPALPCFPEGDTHGQALSKLVPILKKLRLLRSPCRRSTCACARPSTTGWRTPSFSTVSAPTKWSGASRSSWTSAVGRANFDGAKSLEGLRVVLQRAGPPSRRSSISRRAASWRSARTSLLIGPTGVGKSHIAQAIGERACRAGHSVHYTSAHDLLAQTASCPGRRFPRTADAALHGARPPDRPMTWASGPLDRDEPLDLYEIIRTRYERGSMIVTSNRAIEELVPALPRRSDGLSGHGPTAAPRSRGRAGGKFLPQTRRGTKAGFADRP